MATAVINPGGAYDANILVVSRAKTEKSFFVSMQTSLSAANCNILTEAFLGSFKIVDTRFCPKM